MGKYNIPNRRNNLFRELRLNMGATKISKGVYEYKGHRISNCGYHHPDHCVWWEAVDLKTGCADYHANTKKELMELIDNGDRGEIWKSKK